MCISPHFPLRISTIPLDGHVTNTQSWAERAGFMGLLLDDFDLGLVSASCRFGWYTDIFSEEESSLEKPRGTRELDLPETCSG